MRTFTWVHYSAVLLFGLILSAGMFSYVDAQEAALTASEQDRLVNLGANISNRIDATVFRLEQIRDRMQKRLPQLGLEAELASDITKRLERIDPFLSEIRSSMNTIDADMQSVAQAENPKARWRDVRVRYLSSKQNLREVRDMLVNAFLLMEDPSSFSPEPAAATSTATTTEPVASSTADTTATTSETVTAP